MSRKKRGAKGTAPSVAVPVRKVSEIGTPSEVAPKPSSPSESTLLDTWMEELKKRDARMEEADRATRSYFTGTLDKLREAITNELHVRAAQRLLVDVLPILNDLDDLLTRSEEAAQDERTARLWNALAAYRRRFYHGLRRLGLEEIRVVERETMFDPDLHECVEPREGEEFPDTEMVPHGAILKVCRKGYRFREELFQAPQVIIKQGEDHVSQGNWD